jgi:hypothetical protein
MATFKFPVSNFQFLVSGFDFRFLSFEDCRNKGLGQISQERVEGAE